MKKNLTIGLTVIIVAFFIYSPTFATIDLNKADDLGEVWGTYNGYDDYLEDDNDEWDDAYEDDFDEDDDLFKYFEVDDEEDDDLEDFESDFKSAYESDYEKAYKNIEDWSSDRDYSDMIEEAGKLGKDYGQYDAISDYFDNQSNDWEEAYEDRFEEDDDLFEYFDIDRADDDDLEDFKSEFESEYEEGYEDEYEDIEDDDDNDKDPEDSEEAEEATIDRAKEDAETFAKIDAKQAAYEDYINNEDNDWTDLYPSNSKLKSKYNLEDDNNDYEEAFLDEYEIQYQLIYEEEYRNANVESIKSKEINAYDHGYQLGTNQGESAGYLDISQEKFSNWKNSYNQFTLKKSLDLRYYLYRHNDEYITSFKNGFRAAFELGYEQVYNDTNVQIENNNMNYRNLSSDEMIIEYESHKLDFLSGGKAQESTIPLYLEFDEGTVYYIDTYMGISEDQLETGGNYGKTYATNSYDVNIFNDSGKVKFEKPVKLAFNFNGSSRVGIYKHERGQWFYLPTAFEEGLVYTEIPEGWYSGGKYALLVDNNYKPKNTIKLHWAYKDIKLFMKRGIINSSFNPIEGVRRKEFCEYIFKNTLGSKFFEYKPTINFKDSDQFGKYANYINYMVNSGYMNGVGEGRFDPDTYMTYHQVEVVMGRILKDTFSWDEISNKLMRKRFQKSAVNEDKSNNINNGEMLFMLNELLGSKALFGDY